MHDDLGEHATVTLRTDVGRSRPGLSRRDVFRAGAGLALLGAGLGAVSRPGDAAAQEATGKITVGFEGAGGVLEEVSRAAADAVVAANPGAEIEIAPAPGSNYATQLFLSLNVGSAPDVFAFTGLGIGEFSAGGFLEPLDAYLATWEDWAQFPESVRGGITYQDKVWALPYSLDSHFFFYRRDLLEQAGLPREWQPATPDEVLAAARAIKAANPDAIPFGLYAGENAGTDTVLRGFLPPLYAYGGTLTDETGRFIIDSCAIRGALGYYETAFQVDQTVPQDTLSASDPAGVLREALRDGELGFLYDGSWVYDDVTGGDPAIAEQIGVALFPLADGSAAIATGGIGTCWYINAASESKALAWEFVKAASSREHQVTLNSGDPHAPARNDAAADPVFQATPFLQTMVGSVGTMRINPPDPAYRQLISVVQKATGTVATGEATPEEAIAAYGEELVRILGPDNAVTQPCP